MIDPEFPDVPEIDAAYWAANEALARIVPPEYRHDNRANDPLTANHITRHRLLTEAAQLTAARELGPLISWHGPAHDGDNWVLITGIADLDDCREFDGQCFDPAAAGPGGRREGCALHLAARAYQREARWDHAPDAAGIWMLMLAPYRSNGATDDEDDYSGHLVGFVILHDRDKDGAYESVAHIWTAKAWRRRGIARALLTEAKARFGFTRVEGPYTADGGAFLRAVGETE